MKTYRITQHVYDATGYTMIISNRKTGEDIAEYRLTRGCEQAEIASMRRVIDRHLAEPNSTLGNYHW